MRVLLIADVGTNAEGFYHIGDEAMLSQMAFRYAHEQPKTQLGLLSRSFSHKNLPVKEYKHLPFPTDELWLRSPLYCAKLIGKCLISRYTHFNFFKQAEQTFLKTLDEYDVFHFTGGGNIYSYHAPWLYYVFFLIWYGRFTEKAVLLTSQTVGPFQWFDGFVAKYFLNLVTEISIREAEPQLKGVTQTKIKSCLDAAYDLPLQAKVLPKKSPGVYRVGISLHSWKNFGPIIENVVVDVLQILAKAQTLEIVLIPHVLIRNNQSWDTAFMSQIQARLPKKIKIWSFTYKEIMSHVEATVFIKTLTSEVDVMVATRYHALVFALFSNIPSISFSLDAYYTQKNAQLFKMIYGENWQRFLLPLNKKVLLKTLKGLKANLKKEKNLLVQKNKELTVLPAELAKKSLSLR